MAEDSQNGTGGPVRRQSSAADPHDDSPGKMFIGGLSWETSEDNLRTYFSKFGEIESLIIMRHPTTGRSRGFGFLTFADEKACDDVLHSGPHELDGRTIDPKRAVARDKMEGNNAGPRVKKIFVGGLPVEATEDALRDYFSKFGTVEDVILQYDRETRRPRGFGFVTFDSEEVVDRVVEHQYYDYGDRKIEVKRAMPREWSTRSRGSSHHGHQAHMHSDGRPLGDGHPRRHSGSNHNGVRMRRPSNGHMGMDMSGQAQPYYQGQFDGSMSSMAAPGGTMVMSDPSMGMGVMPAQTFVPAYGMPFYDMNGFAQAGFYAPGPFGAMQHQHVQPALSVAPQQHFVGPDGQPMYQMQASPGMFDHQQQQQQQYGVPMQPRMGAMSVAHQVGQPGPMLQPAATTGRDSQHH